MINGGLFVSVGFVSSSNAVGVVGVLKSSTAFEECISGMGEGERNAQCLELKAVDLLFPPFSMCKSMRPS